MAWTQKEQIATAVSVTGTAGNSDEVTLTLEKTAVIQVVGDFPGGPTDDLEISVLTTLDDATETWDTAVYGSVVTLSKLTDPGSVTITVSGVYRFKLLFARSGSTDTITVNAYMRIYEKGA